MRVEIAFATGANPYAWVLGISRLGVETRIGPASVDVWTDVSADVRDIVVRRGRSRELEAFQPGSCSITLRNEARAYDPLNLAGPHVSGGATQVKPGRRIRIIATHPVTLVEYPMFYGTIREWGIDYQDTIGSVSVQATDLMGDLANTQVAVTLPAGTPGAAFDALMAAAGIARYRALEGASALQSTAFEGDALTAAQLIADSEQGAVYVDASGVLRLDGRHTILVEERSRDSQATFGTGDLDITAPVLDYASDNIRNDVSFTRAGGTAQVATDAASQHAYGKRSYAKTGLATALDAEVESLARHVRNSFAEPVVRVRGLTLASHVNAARLTQALGRELRDRVTVRIAPALGGTVIQQQVFVSGIQHTIVPGERMQTVYQFESTAGAYGWVLGVSQLGVDTQITA